MKGFTKTILLSLVMLFVAISVNAQTKWQKKKAHEEANKLRFALELDDETTDKVYEVFLENQVKLKAINNAELEGTITAEERTTKAKVIWKENQIQIEKVLGLELSEKYRIYRKKLREEKAEQGS